MTSISHLLRKLQKAPPKEAWTDILSFAWEICSPAFSVKKKKVDFDSEVSQRDRALAPVDLFLATAGWDLWQTYSENVPRTAEKLIHWWNTRPPGRAVLILDGLSLRETPWLLEGAKNRGYTIHHDMTDDVAGVTGAEIPADTNSFARALGFHQRSDLENNGAGKAHGLKEACTDTTYLPWRECMDLINSSTDWVLWHHWPDDSIHKLGVPGLGLSALTKEVATQLTNDDFWALVERLATGRRLLITSDHGYAATGSFPDTEDKRQVQYLKTHFKGGRYTVVRGNQRTQRDWAPPIDIVIDRPHDRQYAFVLGRRKWKTQGGYPTLAHGGLSLLEVAVPFIELSKTASN